MRAAGSPARPRVLPRLAPQRLARLLALACAVAAAAWPSAARQDALLAAPAEEVLRFGVIGDNGDGSREQYEVGAQLASAHAAEPLDLVIMLGDNMYGRQKDPADFAEKFERPYTPLLASGVRFYAALGNHDDPENRSYAGFNMGGARYYSFVRRHVRFVVFDTNMMDSAQLAWIDATLGAAAEPWKICYFHHPIYSNGKRHGPDVELRVLLEPLMVRHGVQVAFSGHEHLYERLKPQRGITYFVAGSSGKLRKGGGGVTDSTAASFDRDQAFMMVEIDGDVLSFQTISRTGRVVDAGEIRRRPTT
jgi:3',5'-cyclic AMP phosphodiesterase CpdA